MNTQPDAWQQYCAAHLERMLCLQRDVSQLFQDDPVQELMLPVHVTMEETNSPDGLDWAGPFRVSHLLQAIGDSILSKYEDLVRTGPAGRALAVSILERSATKKSEVSQDSYRPS